MNFKHGFSDKTPEYKAWTAMNYRCYNPNCPYWIKYGGRGITVCDRWRSSFINFLKDMGTRPIGGSLERVDNSGNYEPKNCKWATRQEQANNTRWNHLIHFRGETHTVSEWGRRLNIDRDIIYIRLQRGWTVERALTKSVRNYPINHKPTK